MDATPADAIRLVALDMDGTLMGADLTVSARVRRSIANARQSGAVVTIATGRMLEVAVPYARDLGLTAPLIAYQGGLIQSPAAPSPLFIAELSRALVHDVLAWSASRDWHMALYTQSEAFAERRSHPAVFREILSQETIVWSDDLGAVVETDQPVKLIFVDDPQIVDEIEASLRDRFQGRMAVVRSHRCVVEGSPLGVTKGSALRRLADQLSIPQAQTMAIGDQDNDVSMIAWAGVGVAMGDGSPAARAAADWIAPPLSDDGAAAAIERFVLGRAAAP